MNDDTVLNPPRFDPSTFQEPEYELLSEIIKQVNNEYSIDSEDQIDLSRISKKLVQIQK